MKKIKINNCRNVTQRNKWHLICVFMDKQKSILCKQNARMNSNWHLDPRNYNYTIIINYEPVCRLIDLQQLIMSQDSIDGLGVILLSIVGLLWGATNPFIEKSVKQKQNYQINDYSPKSVVSVAASKLFAVSMAINQVGSVLYASLLGQYGQQYTNLLANSFATIFTFASQCLLKRQKPQTNKIFGIMLVIFGMTLLLL